MSVFATSGFGAHAIYLVAAIPLVVAIIVALIVWRNARRERGSRALWTRLADPDPRARCGALDAMSDDAVEHNAPMLCELLKVERDPDVLDALAAAVARTRWEPTTDPSLLELRRWVAGGQARTTRSSREPAPQGVPPVDVDAHDAAGLRDTAPAAPAGAVAGATAPGAPSASELAELVPRVRAVLGDELERLELVSIDGEVLARWSSTQDSPTG